jgi:predicted transposase/invertase (TIGR01784 family)
MFNDKPEILPATDDWIFKLLFGNERNKNLLAAFLKTFVNLPDEEFEITFLDTYLKPEFEQDKMGIVDVKLQTKSKKIIDIEIQMADVADIIGKRISFYKSKLITEQIAKKQSYDVIQQVICVFIMDWTFFKNETSYLNDFRFCNMKSGQCFEDMPEEIYTLELAKVPAASDHTALWNWMRFLKAREREEFEMIAETNTEMRDAVDELYTISSNAEIRAQYELRQKAYRDRAAALNIAELRGENKVISLLEQGYTLEQVKTLLAQK